ncbi:hypothetical protein FK484_0044 [Listeria phage LP-031]|uniref:Uncharacterized protein n=3 Tax=Homburgvirus TaxID=1921125 RepID=A0A514U758_9CAUD|nr:hypothetical protein FK484_0044 [Listeria phage LP-031]
MVRTEFHVLVRFKTPNMSTFREDVVIIPVTQSGNDSHVASNMAINTVRGRLLSLRENVYDWEFNTKVIN